eukprot:Sdes_comp15096_c0_seq2m3894
MVFILVNLEIFMCNNLNNPFGSHLFSIPQKQPQKGGPFHPKINLIQEIHKIFRIFIDQKSFLLLKSSPPKRLTICVSKFPIRLLQISHFSSLHNLMQTNLR